MDADGQYLSKNQLNFRHPSPSPICRFVERTWLLQVSVCTLVLMAQLKYISVIRSAPVLFKLVSTLGTPLWNPVLLPVRPKNTHLPAWKTEGNVVRPFLGFDFRQPLMIGTRVWFTA